MEISVIIPTYNRKAILAKCLKAILSQTALAFTYEVIVVDDGSTDGTQDMTSTFETSSSITLKYFKQPNKGPAAARNLGVRKAQGKLVLFIGDDIIASPNLLAEHLAWHEKYPKEDDAVLGYVTWSPEIKVTPFMRWLERGGPQFKYWTINNPQNVSWRHLYTANISFKRQFLLEDGFFDEDFPNAAYEDTELGYRLHQRGLRIVYNKRAVAYHYHPISLRDAMERISQRTESRRIFWEKTGRGNVNNRDCRGRLHRTLSQIKFWIYRQIGNTAGRWWNVPAVYAYLMDKAHSEGLKNG